MALTALQQAQINARCHVLLNTARTLRRLDPNFDVAQWLQQRKAEENAYFTSPAGGNMPANEVSNAIAGYNWNLNAPQPPAAQQQQGGRRRSTRRLRVRRRNTRRSRH